MVEGCTAAGKATTWSGPARGMHLVLGVETEKAVENTLDRYAGDIKDALKKKDMPFIAVERSGSRGVSVKVPTSLSADSAAKLLKDDFPYLDASSPIGSEGNIEITAGITKKRWMPLRTLRSGKGSKH